MAKLLGKDQATYAKERDCFVRDLKQFHETRGTPFKRCPTLGGKEIDLYLLYSLVTAQGGWIKVNLKNAWSDLLPSFKLPRSCTNACIALKQIYLRYLDRWEKVHYLGEEGDRGDDEDEESRHKRWSARTLHSVPHVYNYAQHNVQEDKREQNHLATNVYKASDYDRLALSLISPLPNEQDFAINVCTLLSNDGKHTLKLEKHPRLIDYLLAHAGIFNHSSLRQLFMHFYGEIRRKPLHDFWSEVLESDEFLDLADEAKFCKPEESKPADTLIKDDYGVAATADKQKAERPPAPPASASTSDCECEIVEDGVSVPKKFKRNADAAEKELFCLRRTMGTQDYVGQRVLQVATILRNLCFIEENVPHLTKNQTFIRFMLLCASAQWNNLRNLGLDMLGNIAAEYEIKDLQADVLGASLLKIVTKNLQSDDRAACLSSIEVLNRLSQNEQNEDVLIRSLESAVYKKVCSFLTIHDVMLLIYTLECLYSLSSLGERSCNFIANNHGVIDTLVSLVTVEGKSYGPRACIGMKLVETVPSGGQQQAQVQQQQSPQPQLQPLSPAVVTSVSSITCTSLTSTVIASPAPPSVTPVKNNPPTTPMRPVAIAPQRLLTTIPSSSSAAKPIVTSHPTTTTKTTPIVTTITPSPSPAPTLPPPMTPQQMIQQQHAHQQAIHENEQFALAWLRATYEPCVSGRIDHQELYKHYINSCSKIGRRGVISPLHFPRCVRSVFGGTVGPNPMKPVHPTDPQFYDGIKATSHPHLSQALLSSSTTPTVITSVATLTQVQPSAVVQQHQAVVTVKQEPQEEITLVKHELMNVKQESGGAGSSTSLIKSLLATKVNDACVSTVSMKTAATDCQNVAQVAARQQRLLAQQNVIASGDAAQKQQQPTKSTTEALKMQRMNGVRQLFSDSGEVGDPAVSSTTQFVGTTIKGKKEPPQPPPPPLAPLSNNVKMKTEPIVNEDSDSIGNNSLSSTSGMGAVGMCGVSSTEDNDNSLTSFECLLNGVPNVEDSINDDSNSKDSVRIVSSEISINKPLRLADLLEKKFEKSPPMLNGSLGKDLKLTDGLDLVENHIEKALSRDIDKSEPDVKVKIELKMEDIVDTKQSLKRPATEAIAEPEAKKPHLSANINGSRSLDSPNPDSVSSSNGEDGPSTVSTAAAKLFADFAADILEDEDEEQLMQEAQQPTNQPSVVDTASLQQATAPIQQIIVDNNQMLVQQPRQIIVSQPQMQGATQSIVISGGTQLKTQSGQTVIVQNTGVQQRPSVLIQQANAGQLLLSQGLQGQVQLLTSSQGGQYVLQASGSQGYMVAQPQTAVVHGQPQTVLVAQTAQQQGTPAKTIIILQQQPANAATHHQKVVVTPQGQQVVVTQVPRPVAQSPTISNNAAAQQQQSPLKVMKPAVSPGSSQTSPTPNSSSTVTNGIRENRQEEVKPRGRIIRDLTTPFVCEWGDCDIETKFKSANEVYMHACKAHCPQGNEEVICQWDRCDNMRRKRFSLMTHLQDRHCNPDVMKQGLIRRKQVAQGLKVEAPTQTPTNHPGYAPDAALHAIKRHALEFVNPKELQLKSPKQGSSTSTSLRALPQPAVDQDDNEGPVTKSIRLTASLILRNLVIYSSNCRRYLKSYESHLANIALSKVESSRTIAQILYDINDGTTNR